VDAPEDRVGALLRVAGWDEAEEERARRLKKMEHTIPAGGMKD